MTGGNLATGAYLLWLRFGHPGHDNLWIEVTRCAVKIGAGAAAFAAAFSGETTFAWVMIGLIVADQLLREAGRWRARSRPTPP